MPIWRGPRAKKEHPTDVKHYGRRFWGFRIIRDNDLDFRRLVAQECYGLTHEFVTNKLSNSFYAGIGTPNYASLLELDRAMKRFTEEV